jgi:hypothetical protein
MRFALDTFQRNQSAGSTRTNLINLLLNAHVMVIVFTVAFSTLVYGLYVVLSPLWSGPPRQLWTGLLGQCLVFWSGSVVIATLYVGAFAPPVITKPVESMLGTHWKSISSFGRTAALLAVGAGAGVYAQDAASSEVFQLLLKQSSSLTPLVAATFFMFFSMWAVGVACFLSLGARLSRDMGRLGRWGRFEATTPTRRRLHRPPSLLRLPTLPPVGRYWIAQLSHPLAAAVAYLYMAWYLVAALLNSARWPESPFPVL